MEKLDTIFLPSLCPKNRKFQKQKARSFDNRDNLFQAIFPSHVKLSEQERSNVCYLAFPDSNSGCMGDTQYHVRIRQNKPALKTFQALKEYDRKSPTFLQSDKDYYWGYVYFRQVKDKTLPRGYFQKVKHRGNYIGCVLSRKNEEIFCFYSQSVVIISKLPFVNLFGEVCALLAPEFFDSGSKVMEVATKEIDQWPPPVPGQTIHLPLLGTLFQVRNFSNMKYKEFQILIDFIQIYINCCLH